eukprot:scaffold54083_cov33-Phaeocystis_antarctica.AAC.1
MRAGCSSRARVTARQACSKCPPSAPPWQCHSSAPAPPQGARLVALGSSALPGRGPGHCLGCWSEPAPRRASALLLASFGEIKAPATSPPPP